MLTREDVDFSISVHPETDHWVGNVCASGDREVDRLAEKWVERQVLFEGNEWAWCIVCITAEIEGFEGTAYLGGCSYESEADFKAGGYYEDLCDEAFEDLCRTVEEVRERVVRLGNLGEKS